MQEYKGNAIYNYILNRKYSYFFCVKNNWVLIYGNACCMPKLLVYVSKVPSLNIPIGNDEHSAFLKSFKLSKYLNLPFLCVRFMPKSSELYLWQEECAKWRKMRFDTLRDVYESFGLVEPGIAKKAINQYSSSPYHDWQRENLGRITVSNLDLIKFKEDKTEENIELKRSKQALESWEPYRADYPNFALLLNTIVSSGKKIKFSLYYTLLHEGRVGERVEDISKIKLYNFFIPKQSISCDQVQYACRGIFAPQNLINGG